jgi:hypothetical protein
MFAVLVTVFVSHLRLFYGVFKFVRLANITEGDPASNVECVKVS